MIAMTSTRRVCKDSLDKLLPWVFSSEFKITLVLQILHSQTLLMLLDSGGFLFHIIYSPPFSSKNCLSGYDPSPEMPNWVLLMPQQNSNHSQIYREYTTSVCIALLDRHIYRAPYLLTSFQPSFTRNDPNKSTPQYINGDSSRILSLGKSAIFCCWSLPLNCLHLTHFKMIHLTKEWHLVTQKPEDLIWPIVIP